jgi:carbamate kinase
MYAPGAERRLVGVEAVIDKDLCSELLAREIEADLLVMATDAAAVFTDFGTPEQRGIHRAHPDALARYSFPAGSMGPKVDAACRFARSTGRTAAIGALADIPEIVSGERGTLVSSRFSGLTWHA